MIANAKTFPVTIISLLLFLGCNQSSFNLEQQISKRLSAFSGEAGIFIQHLETGETVAIKADSLFPTASMIKVPILIALFDRIEQDTSLKYRGDLTWYADSVNYPYGGGILASFHDGSQIPLSKVISLMITYSDNHASLWC